MAHTERSRKPVPGVIPQDKSLMEPSSSDHDLSSQIGQCALSVVEDSSESGSPTPPLSTPSASIQIDDALSDVSSLSPHTPLTGMSPSSNHSQRTSIRDWESPVFSARVSLVNTPPEPSYRIKARGLVCELPKPSPMTGFSILSPVDAIRKLEVLPLPSPMTRDLRRRVEADAEDSEMDITTPYDEGGYKFGDIEHKSTSSGTSCLGLDLGLPAPGPGDTTPGLGALTPSESHACEQYAKIGVNREPGVEQFRAQIMQATLAHSASAELVLPPERPQSSQFDVFPGNRDLKVPIKNSKKHLPLPEPHLESPFLSVPAVQKDLGGYNLPSPPEPAVLVNTESGNFKHLSRSRIAHSFGRLLGSPSPKRRLAHRDAYSGRNTIDLNQLRMHGYARFPQRFPEGHLLEEDFAREYQLESELGAGGYGFVLSAYNMITGERVAVKFINRSQIPSHGLTLDYNGCVIPREAAVLRLAQHPGVVQFRALYKDRVYFYLVQELHGDPWSKNSKNQNKVDQKSSIPNANAKSLSPSTPYAPVQSSPLRPPMVPRRLSCDLFECIEHHKRLEEGIAKYIFAQVADTVQYLDSIGITHRDIKDENLVIDKDFKVKLIDFGSAVMRDIRKSPPTYTRFYGTVTFAAPEILKDLQYTAPPAEVWTLGILLSFLVTGQSPFPTPEHAKHGIACKPNGSIEVSPLCADLMDKCLEPDPARRLTIRQVREHPWLRGALDPA